MKKSCVIFACTILSEDRVPVLLEFLDGFKKDFLDCDFYIGINPSPVEVLEELITDSNIEVKGMARVAEDLYTESDASAYQLALKLASESNTSYDNYWFIHTKGSVNTHSDYLRIWYLTNFLSDRSNIESFLNERTGVGSYGMLGVAYSPHNTYLEQDVGIPLFENIITEALPYTHANFFYIHSLYVIKGHIVDKFIQLIASTWFTSKLNSYYFEGIFPFIVSRLGYYPYVSNEIDMNGHSLLESNNSWLSENDLVSYKEYLDLHKTNYKFNQLKPPYN